MEMFHMIVGRRYSKLCSVMFCSPKALNVRQHPLCYEELNIRIQQSDLLTPLLLDVEHPDD